MDPAIEMKKVEHGGGGVAEASATTAPTPAERIAEALAMVEAFESVGVTLFGVTLTDRDQEPVKYKADRSSVRLREALAAGYLFVCEARQQNLIVRPKPNGARLVQLDDVSRERAEALASLALFTLETSPGNFQLWMAVADISDDQARDLKCALGVDKNASRAARLAGSANVKMKYAPNYPVVRLRTVAPGRIVTADELRALDLLPEAAPPAEVERRPRAPDRSGPRAWPSYDRCLEEAGPARSHRGQDRSQADFLFALYALSRKRGFDEAEIVAELLARSEKAAQREQEREGGGRAYVEMTVRAAARVARRNR